MLNRVFSLFRWTDKTNGCWTITHSTVMAGLVPAIHDFDAERLQDVDARDISAFTRVFDALCAGMTMEMPSTL